MQEVAVYAGYFASYYVGAKRPKPPEKIIERAKQAAQARAKQTKTGLAKPDVELFQRREQARVSKLQQRK